MLSLKHKEPFLFSFGCTQRGSRSWEKRDENQPLITATGRGQHLLYLMKIPIFVHIVICNIMQPWWKTNLFDVAWKHTVTRKTIWPLCRSPDQFDGRLSIPVINGTTRMIYKLCWGEWRRIKTRSNNMSVQHLISATRYTTSFVFVLNWLSPHEPLVNTQLYCARKYPRPSHKHKTRTQRKYT